MDRISALIAILCCALVAPAAPSPQNPDRAEMVDALFGNPLFIDAKLSPDGRYLASLSHYRGKRSIIVLDLETKEITGLTVESGDDVSDFHWIGPDRIVYHVSQWEIYTKGLYFYPVGRNKSRKLIDPQHFIFRGMVDPLVQDGTRFIFKGSTGDSARAPDLYVMDIDRDTINRLAKNTGDISYFILGQDSQPVFALEYRDNILHVLAADGSGGWEPAEGDFEDFMPLGMLSDDRHLLVSILNDDGFSGLNLFDLASGQLANKTRYYPGYDLFPQGEAGIIRENTTGDLLGIRFNHEKPENFWFIGGPRQIEDNITEAYPGLICEFLGFNPASRCIYFILSGDVQPPVVMQFNLDTGSSRPIYQQFPKVREFSFRPMEPVAFPGPDGAGQIHGYLTRPEGEGPFPTVVLVHGGPSTRDNWGFDPQVQFLALNGYAVFQVNYRGSTGFGSRYRLDGLAEIADASVYDVIAGTRWLVEQGVADPGRIAIMGGSFGGYVSLAAGTRAPDLWAAHIGFAGVYDLNLLYTVDKRGGYSWVDDLFEDYDEGLYSELSPVNHAAKLQAPVLLIHGKSDKRVSASHAKRMSKALQSAGKEVETVYLSWGVHGLPEEKDRRKYFLKILSFLEEHLQ